MIRHTAKYAGKCYMCACPTFRGETVVLDGCLLYCADCGPDHMQRVVRRDEIARDAFAAGKWIGDAQD